MFKSFRAVRLATGAVAAMLAGTATPAWATYGGGACHSCAPSPVVATSVVALAPQVQTVYQTVYETVYENEPVTVMETRYRTAYKTENYTVMRPVTETSYVERKYTVAKPVYQTVNQERRYTVTKPVYQTERRERRYTVAKPVYQTVNQERRYTVMKPVVRTQQMERRYTVAKPVYQTQKMERRYTVMKPVYQTERRERRYTVSRPVYQTVNQERRYTVMKPVSETVMVDQPYTVCRPVTTVRQETVETGYYERQYTTIPGPVVERQVRVPVQECDACGFEKPRGLLGCLHKKKVTTTVAVQCPPRVVSQRVFVSRPVTRDVTDPFSAVVFKVQAGMDASHRDRLAFMRIVSGEFERGMVVTHAQTGKPFATKYAQAVFGRDRATVDTAYPGDVVGLVNAMTLAPGDTLFTDPSVQYPPIPSFAPEHFAVLRADSAGKYKQFRKGMDQLDSEGVVQVLRNDLRGDASPVLAAVGPMQFEVVTARLKAEFNVDTSVEFLGFSLARRTDDDSADELNRQRGVEVFTRSDGALLALVSDKWRLQYIEKEHPDLTLEPLVATAD